MKSENYQIKMSQKYSYSTKIIITIAEHEIEKNKPTKKILVHNFKVPLLLLTMVPLKSKHIIPLLLLVYIATSALSQSIAK